MASEAGGQLGEMASPLRLSESLRSPHTQGQEGWEVCAQPGWRAAATRVSAGDQPSAQQRSPTRGGGGDRVGIRGQRTRITPCSVSCLRSQPCWPPLLLLPRSDPVMTPRFFCPQRTLLGASGGSLHLPGTPSISHRPFLQPHCLPGDSRARSLLSPGSSTQLGTSHTGMPGTVPSKGPSLASEVPQP